MGIIIHSEHVGYDEGLQKQKHIFLPSKMSMERFLFSFQLQKKSLDYFTTLINWHQNTAMPRFVQIRKVLF